MVRKAEPYDQHYLFHFYLQANLTSYICFHAYSCATMKCTFHIPVSKHGLLFQWNIYWTNRCWRHMVSSRPWWDWDLLDTSTRTEFAVLDEDKTRGCDKGRKYDQVGAHSNAQFCSSNMVQEFRRGRSFPVSCYCGLSQGTNTLSPVISAIGNSGGVSCFLKYSLST